MKTRRHKIKEMEYIEKLPYSLKVIGIPVGDTEVSIYIRLILNRQKTEFAIGVKGEIAEWNNEEFRFDNSRSYNNYLNNNIRDSLGKVYQSYINLRDQGIKPTASKIKAVFKGDESIIKSPELIKCLEEHIKKMQLLPNMYATGTIAHYKTLKKYLLDFLLDNNMTKMRIDEWRRRHFVQFEQFMLTKPNELLKRPIGRATSNKYISKLKVIFNSALANEIIVLDPTKGFKMERVSGTREYLTSDQVQEIESNDLGGNESLDRVRWIFLFSVYSGLRFSDAMSLTRFDIIEESDGNFYIDLIQKKTQQRLYRPLLGKAIKIYKKFEQEDLGSPYVLPRISNQKTNAYLKVIADLCGIKKTLSHHIARHTFATTILLDSGVDLKATCFFMGHSSVKTTEVYAKITKNRAVDVVSKLNSIL